MRNKGLITKIVILMFLIALPLTSLNWDRVELENRAFVNTLGVDAAADGGFVASVLVVDALALEEGDEAIKIFYQAAGQTLDEAIGWLAGETSKQIYFGHAKAVVLGGELLKNTEMLAQSLQNLLNFDEINSRIGVVGVAGYAADFMQDGGTPQGNFLGSYLADFFGKNGVSVATMETKMDLEQIFTTQHAGGAVLLPKIRLLNEDDDNTKIDFDGAFVLNNFKQAGHVAKEDLAGYIWLTANAKGMQVPLDGGLTLQVNQSRPKISFYKDDQALHCVATVDIKAQLQGRPNAEKTAEIKQNATQKIEAQMALAFDIFQQNFAADALNLKDTLRKHHPALYRKFGGNWGESFANMHFTPVVKIS